MKKTLFFSLFATLLLFLLPSCRTEKSDLTPSPSSSATRSTAVLKTPVPPTTEVAVTFNATAPDDIFPTPGGDAYAANVFQQGVANPWPPVAIATASLVKGTDQLLILYRKDIDTKAGQTRNNIIQASKSSSFLVSGNLSFYSLALPPGIELGSDGGSGRPGLLTRILVIKILPEVAPGSYTFQIGIELDGVDYGTLPCTINIKG